MNENRQAIVNKTVKTGISFGSALAMVISYTTWHSVGWAILHGLLSWVYVIYFVITTLIISKKPVTTGKSRDKATEFTTKLLLLE